MNRYTDSSIIKDATGQRRFDSAVYRTIPILDTDLYIRVSGIERLDRLAAEFYGKYEYWPVIALANNLGKGTLMVHPGTRLRIPDPVTIQNYNNLINTNR